MSVLDGATVRPFGITGLVLEYGDVIDPDVHALVVAADRAVDAALLPGVEEVVPSYRSLLLRLDPLRTSPDEVLAALRDVEPATVEERPTVRTVSVDFDAGEDLDAVAARAGLDDAAAVVELLVGATLRLYLYGFAPGFAYLGGVPDALRVPRRTTPRPPVPAGSVLLAAGQAALCPVSMPTGWWVVGNTDVTMFDPTASPPVPMRPGDRVRLVAS